MRRRHPDDLSGWADEPVVRALNAPGTPEELAGEAEAMAAFRAASRGSRRRFVGRFGAGASTIVAAVALSGGAAAAYTHVLPTPIQRVAHGLLGPVGVPGPSRHHATASARGHHPAASPAPLAGGTSATSRPAPNVAHSPTPGPHASGPVANRSRPGAVAKPGHGPSAQPSPTGASPSAPVAAPTPAPTTPSPSPSVTPRLKPAHLTMTLTAQRVPAGSGDSASGQVTADSGQPVVDRRVSLAQRIPGQPGWERIASGSTDAEGNVTLSVPSVSRTVRWRLVTGRVRSPASRVIVVPQLSVAMSYDGQQENVTITAQGAQVGDTLAVQRRVQQQWQQVQTASFGDSGAASFSVIPPHRGKARFRVVLRATMAHGYAQARFAVPPERPRAPGNGASR